MMCKLEGRGETDWTTADNHHRSLVVYPIDCIHLRHLESLGLGRTANGANDPGDCCGTPSGRSLHLGKANGQQKYDAIEEIWRPHRRTSEFETFDTYGEHSDSDEGPRHIETTAFELGRSEKGSGNGRKEEVC